MRLLDIALVASLALASTAFGAECFAQSGGSSCLSKDAMTFVVQQHCAAHWQEPSTTYITWGNAAGTGHIGHIGAWGSPDECVQAGTSVVDQCHGQRDGGSWTFDGKSISVSFCLWANGT